MKNSTIPHLKSLPDGPFTRQQASEVAAQYQNVTIEDDMGTRFSIVLSHEGFMIWQTWNFEQGSRWEINHAIKSYGIRKPQ
ncbi:DUF905 domain-containing protein [Erwinia psidii]|uniref:DUF905 family protein n=1 Tax=Erwinia psidii TaxID=69224 RepID=UPI00226BAE98|nr:DUF905 family protein [Erwinia psidii]MCX8967221.1 DUF905 domain-containing protein [Erwinia psidii]